VRIEAWQVTSEVSENPHVRFDRVCKELMKFTDCEFLVLPELWAEGAFNLTDTRDDSPEFDLTRLFEIAISKKIWIWTGTFLIKDQGSIKNRGFLIAPNGKPVLRYDKCKVFSISGNEGNFVSSGDHIPVISLNGFLTAFLTCFDLRFATLFHALAMRGVELVIISAAWPLKRISHWDKLLAARSIECQAYVLGCNGEGLQSDEMLGGGTKLYDPNGNEVRKALGSKKERGIFQIEKKVLLESRLDFPFLEFLRNDWMNGKPPIIQEYQV
jgi:omega-amidase